jgi:hypothetical protein
VCVCVRVNIVQGKLADVQKYILLKDNRRRRRTLLLRSRPECSRWSNDLKKIKNFITCRKTYGIHKTLLQNIFHRKPFEKGLLPKKLPNFFLCKVCKMLFMSYYRSEKLLFPTGFRNFVLLQSGIGSA